MSVDSAVEDCRKWQLSKTIGNPIIRHRSKSAKIETPPRYEFDSMRNKIQQKKKEKSEGGGYGDGQVWLDGRRVVDSDVVD